MISSDRTPERLRMVETQLVGDGRNISDILVLDAMRRVPRHAFVPTDMQSHAYDDGPQSIGYGQTISQPYIVALMSEQLVIVPGLKVLEVGTGSGYQAAVLAEMGARVFSIEIIEPLAKLARANLNSQGYSQVEIRAGDGCPGWPEESPFERIIVTCSPEDIPQSLVGQLAEGGRMIIPVGDRYRQDLFLLEKKDGELQRTAVLPVRFVPMTRSDD